MTALTPPLDEPDRSLAGLHGSVRVPRAGWGRLGAYLGPGLLIGVGYMDPGNWGTDLAAGALFRYDLLWVVALASLMAVVLQLLAARLGLASGRDLAQAVAETYPGWVRLPYWLLAELAIIACDLAEVLGSAVALSLLFHLPMLGAVAITGADVLLLLGLQRYGMRTIEAVVAVLVLTIAGCYVLELFVLPGTRPDFGEIGGALLHPGLARPGMATIAVGIVGATVMPHNLYLHSALVQSRRGRADAEARRAAIRFTALDTVVALLLAFFVNAAILVLAAIVFHGRPGALVDGRYYAFGPDTDWIRVAYLTFAPLVGTALASTLFAVALLASGQSSTITGTLAGQVVMEGLTRFRVSPWQRRLVTRLCAIVPAVALIAWRGEGSVNDLLILSQVVLALQLPFAMLPLLHLVGRRRLGAGRPGRLLLGAGWLCAAIILAFDLYGLPDAARAAAQLLLRS
ncbi:Nramp family divalent metal transporter [Sphingomonas morindae]|uniref:Nramp family divalent metal transporter n=1 Tax=Sphingomonas morindae TaxID=1541170 RepID=A0ABY4XBF4_9SPHN|nr:Nramp family divalent metal transporter [Sphingomonas morindae]USI74036.1 Nramp family divalent metal transporter [Sphingomonas morindae]